MKTISFYVVALLCLCATKLYAQETFSQRANTIAENIERITKEQKDSLKIEVEAVNLQLDNNELTPAQADAKKQELAQVRAEKIETLVAVEQQKLDALVKDKVDGKINEESYNVFNIRFGKNKRIVNDSIRKHYTPRRTTSQFVFALGVNRLMHDGEADTENFKWRSDFYEWGVSWNTRIFKNNNLLHAKYGLSVQYNNLRPDNDQIFVRDGVKTILADAGRSIDVARLRYVNLVVPAHLEFDFTKKKLNGEKVTFPSHKSFRVGLGGYVGANIKEKQILKFKNDNGNDVKEKTKGGYNVSDFVYGLSAYVGYRQTSLYVKYDLQPVFNSNEIDQNNLSLGIRFDLN